MDTPEDTPKPEEAQSPAPSQPKEEPIVLSKLFPDAQQDLDALFPDAGMKQLLKEVVRTRQKNERFLKKLDIGKVASEEDEEPV